MMMMMMRFPVSSLFYGLGVLLSLWSSRVAADQQARISVTGALTGVNVQTGAAPPRMNINHMWAQGGPAWDLYVLALAELQAVAESEELSYFQIMGIHGLPFQGWNGVGQVDGGAERAGFCPHNHLLFGTWHRPYVALYEQTLVSHAINISTRYEGIKAPAYRAAAQALRVAYWDWAANYTLPEVVTLPTISATGPTGSVTIRNPFHGYYFQNFPFTIQYMNTGVLSQWNHTTRCPNVGVVDNTGKINSGLSSCRLMGQVYDVFSTVTAFQDMETDRYTSKSFESPHNNVHDGVGCSNGTMYDLNWSAFDPLFMLHHANVDRLMALWQAIYPNSTIFTIADLGGALFGTAAGTVNATTPLKPFYKQDGTFHTSESVRNISTFGYTYPELQQVTEQGSLIRPLTLSDYVRMQVNNLYGNEYVAGLALGRRSEPSRRTWSVAISVDRADVLLPATIICYVGDKIAGKMSILSLPTTGVTHTSILLDEALSAANLDLADDHAVGAFLNDTLRFEVRQGNGTICDVDSIPNLELDVQDRTYTLRKSDSDFPSYGSVNRHAWNGLARHVH